MKIHRKCFLFRGWPLLVVLGVLGLCPAARGDSGDEGEPVFVDAKVLGANNPRLGSHRLGKLLKVVYPGLRRVPADLEPGTPVIRWIEARSGRLLRMGEDGIEQTRPALVLMIVPEVREENLVDWLPELAVLELRKGKPIVLAHEVLDGFTHEFALHEDAGSGLYLDLWRLHPGASAIGVKGRRAFVSPHERSTEVNLVLFVLAEDSLEELYSQELEQSNSDHQPPDELEEGEEPYFAVSISQTTVQIGKRRSEGLFGLLVESFRSESDQGDVAHSEMIRERLCFEGDGYGLCQEEEPPDG